MERQQALGHALGRVLAHELYRILANAERLATQELVSAVEPLLEQSSPKNVGFLEANWKAVAEG
jgi:surfactin synthase thioesterase subunit